MSGGDAIVVANDKLRRSSIRVACAFDSIEAARINNNNNNNDDDCDDDERVMLVLSWQWFVIDIDGRLRDTRLHRSIVLHSSSTTARLSRISLLSGKKNVYWSFGFV